MILTQQLGLHRDGSRWGLPEVDAEPRRRTFWEVRYSSWLLGFGPRTLPDWQTYTEDVLQCVTQGRPRSELFVRYKV